MRIVTAWAISLALLSLASAQRVSAAAVPVAAGNWEIQIGAAGITLPEQYDGTFSMQPEARVAFFLLDGLALQAEGDVRVWPLGAIAPDSYGGAGALVWFPPGISVSRNLFLRAGLGAALVDPAGPVEDGSVESFFRGGIGFKVPLSEVGLQFARNWFFTMEYRGDFLLQDPEAVSGIGIGVSIFP